MSSKKEILLKSFSEMNIDMLELLLDDSKTYNDASKETILIKLRELFDEFKEEKDTMLIPFAGKCDSEDCPNKGCKGYTFIGNHSKKHTDFIIEETETDWKDFYHCATFKANDPSVEMGDDISFCIRRDEEADFKPSIDYLIKAQDCEKAMGEILKDELNCLDKEDYVYWLEKHEELFNSLSYPYTIYSRVELFWDIYYELKSLSSVLKFMNEAGEAVNAYSLFSKENEDLLLRWLVNYEELGQELYIITDTFDDDEEMKTGFVSLTRHYNLKIKVNDYSNGIALGKIFHEHYWKMVEKYQTKTLEDNTAINPNSEEWKEYNSLRYHLKKREMI